MLSLFSRDTSERDAVQADFEARRAKARAEYERQLETLDTEQTKAINEADKRAEDADPAVQEQRRLMIAQSEAHQRAAERLAVLNRLLDAERKRKEPTRADVAAASASLSAHPEDAIASFLRKET